MTSKASAQITTTHTFKRQLITGKIRKWINLKLNKGLSKETVTASQSTLNNLRCVPPYQENSIEEQSPTNIRFERVKQGGPLFLPEMIATNSLLPAWVKNKRVVDIGAGSGLGVLWSAPHAQKILALEPNPQDFSHGSEQYSFDNVRWVQGYSHAIETPHPLYDLAVCMDVIEHVPDTRDFINECQRLAKSLLLSTPNRANTRYSDYQPHWDKHIKEFTAGEIYMVLKIFYTHVFLWGLTDPRDANSITSIRLNSTAPTLFAFATNDKKELPFQYNNNTIS